jgi:hypothetical protein
VLTFALPGVVLGSVAFALGGVARNRIRAGRGPSGGEQLAAAGRLIGALAAVIGVLGIVLLVLFLLAGAASRPPATQVG